MNVAISKAFRTLALVLTPLAILATVHRVLAQDGVGTTMSEDLAQAVDRQMPTRETLLPDGRMLVLDNTRGDVRILDATPAHREQSHFSFVTARRFAGASVAPDGRVLIWGGVDTKGQSVAGGFWFDPRSNAMVAAQDVSLLPRAGQTMNVLSDGRLLVTGGWSPRLGTLTEAETWDFASKHVRLESDRLAPARLGHSGTLQPDGGVLFQGGVYGGGKDVRFNATFDPASGRFRAAPTPPAGAVPTKPAVVASFPAANAIDVPIDARLMVRFSMPVDVRTVNASTVTLIGSGGPISLRAVAVEGGRLAFVKPVSELVTGSHYTLFVQGVLTERRDAVPFTAIDFTTAKLGTSGGPATGGPVHVPAGPGGSPGSSAPGSAGSHSPGTVQGADPNSSPAGASLPLRVMTGYGLVDRSFLFWSHVPACGYFEPATLRLCRAQSLLGFGQWTPGDDIIGTLHSPRWRVNKPDMTAQEIAAAALATHAKGGNGPAGVSGRVELVDGQPLANVDVSIGSLHARTGSTGEFRLIGAPAGHQWLYVDGGTANKDGREYGQFVVGVNLRQGIILPLDYRMYVPTIRVQDKFTIPSPTARDMIVTHPEIPGLEIHIPAGTVIRDFKGKIITQLSIVPTPVDRAPFPTPKNFPVYFSIEPAGATVQNVSPGGTQGIRVVYPNYGHEAANTETSFYVYHPDDGWKVYGKGRVSADGAQVVPEAGVKLVWIMGGSFGLNNNHPPKQPQTPECGKKCGDPVDLFTGTFEESRTDIAIDDVVPIALSRTFRHGVISGYGDSFGGWSSSYDMYLYSSDGTFTTVGLRLPDGNMLTFVGTTTIYGDVRDWNYTGSPSVWYGATLVAKISPTLCWFDPTTECYLLTRKDGVQFRFPRLADTGPQVISDRFGNQVVLTYSAGQLQQVTSPSGRYIHFTWWPTNVVHTAYDNAGRTWNYDYDALSYLGAFTIQALKTVTFPDTTTEKYSYITDTGDIDWSALKTIVDRNTHTVLTNFYQQQPTDPNWGRVTQQLLADNTSYYFSYPSTGNNNTREADVTDPNGHVSKVVMDSTSGYMLQETLAAGTPQEKTIVYSPDASGLVHAINEPLTPTLTRTTTIGYDTMGNVTDVTRAFGTSSAVTQHWQYQASSNQVHTYTDENGNTSEYDYTNGCLTRVTDPLGHATTIICTEEGLPRTVTDALGHVTTLGYQGSDLRTMTDPLGRTMTYTRDLVGRMTAVSDPLGRLTRIEYDPNNDRVSRTIDPSGRASSATYYPNGQPYTITLSGGGVISYQYDIRDRLQVRTDALLHHESWTYDNLGHVLTYRDRNHEFSGLPKVLHYDYLDRNDTITYPDGSTTNIGYDIGDRATNVNDSVSGNQIFTPDVLDRTLTANLQQGTLNYTYDAAGRPQTMKAPTQAPVVYVWDIANRLTGITQGSANVTIGYDDADRRTTVTLPNGVMTTYAYDSADQVTSFSFAKSNGTTLGMMSYSYDSVGQRTSQTGSYASQSLPGSLSAVVDQIYHSDRLTTLNGLTQQYDANGNLLSDGTNTYVWNVRDQLVQIKQGSTVTATFAYDAQGRRISKTEGGQTIAYLYDGANAIQEISGGVINPILTGLGIDSRYARNDTSSHTRTYFVTDALGSTRALTNGTGNVVDKYDYDPYGSTTQSATGYSNPYQYTGREIDQSGLYFNRARYYQPATGRFLSEDAIGLAGGANSFAYVGGDPLDLTDQFGLCPFCNPGVPHHFNILDGGTLAAPTRDRTIRYTGNRKIFYYQLMDACDHALPGRWWVQEHIDPPDPGADTNTRDWSKLTEDEGVWKDKVFPRQDLPDGTYSRNQTFTVSDTKNGSGGLYPLTNQFTHFFVVQNGVVTQNNTIYWH